MCCTIQAARLSFRYKGSLTTLICICFSHAFRSLLPLCSLRLLGGRVLSQLLRWGTCSPSGTQWVPFHPSCMRSSQALPRDSHIYFKLRTFLRSRSRRLICEKMRSRHALHMSLRSVRGAEVTYIQTRNRLYCACIHIQLKFGCISIVIA